MRDLTAELKELLRLHGMAGAWADPSEQGESAVATPKWLIEHLLLAEYTDRAMRSLSHQMNAAKFLMHRDLTGFDFEAPACSRLVRQMPERAFIDAAQNAVFINGPGTSKTHLAVASAVSRIASRGKWGSFYPAVDPVNTLEREKRKDRWGVWRHPRCRSTS